MTLTEERDLARLQEKLNKIARDAMDALRHGAESSPELLKASGAKDNAHSVLSSFWYYRKQMDKAIAEHIKKYPDGGE